ncbi:MAG: hypothetical protein AMS22_14320 [Thiotrichales bacterium SG8_50]|nr:MAG: hypothetical protein AMS22_14320 [Thiotrichales bacterium SG8_50]
MIFPQGAGATLGGPESEQNDVAGGLRVRGVRVARRDEEWMHKRKQIQIQIFRRCHNRYQQTCISSSE